MRRRLPFALLGALAIVACQKDVVPPDVVTNTDCGNGVLEEGEACDVDSPGCVSCVVVPEWSCTTDGCTQLCGDGVVGAGTDCSSPHRDATCDLTGYWAARESDYTHDQVLNALQASSSWYLYRFTQTGDQFVVAEELECGVHVTGSATVDETPGTLRALAWANRMDGLGPHPARGGTSTAVANGCAISFDRWYKIRGADPTLLPSDFSAHPALTSLAPLPSVSDPVTSLATPAGSEDTDGDGIPGVAYAINAGFFTGVRNTAQRDWKEYATAPNAPVDASALTFAIPGAFDLQESILRVTDCADGCAFIAAGAYAATDVTPKITFSFVGKALGSARVRQVVAGTPRQSLDDDLTTCANVRLMLPHDPSTP